MMYIAYTYKGPGQHLVESSAHNSRDAAARELFAKLPSGHKTVETSRAIEQFGKWLQYGIDIHSHRRDQV